jgi:serine phosphatase RsbU (regulator of sigma subunit)/uncharacterized integral membrane protein
MERSAPGRLFHFIRESLRDDFSGPHGPELRQAQKEIILSRTVILIWISVFVMPTTICAYVFFAKREALPAAVAIVSAAVAAVLFLRFLLKRGLFEKHHHLAMVMLVGGVFGPTGTAIVELTHGSGGDFFFAFFLIYFAYGSLFPSAAKWSVITSACVVASWITGRFLRSEGLVADHQFFESLLYFFQLTFIGLVLNRVIVKLFLGERRATIELRLARDSLISEMKVAQQIQQLLLPKEPKLPDHDIFGVMVPADDVGGDYYDVLASRTGRCFVAIGDVSGHGVTAGVTMMMARSTLVATLEADPSVSLQSIYLAVNRALRENLRRMDLDLYMTFLLLEYLGAGDYRAVGAHLPMLIHRKSSGEVDQVIANGAWLGMIDDLGETDLPLVEFHLDPGDLLFLYTDGIVERRTADRKEMFGYPRLNSALQKNAQAQSSQVLVENVLAEMRDYSSFQDDDVTLVALRRQGP